MNEPDHHFVAVQEDGRPRRTASQGQSEITWKNGVLQIGERLAGFTGLFFRQGGRGDWQCARCFPNCFRPGMIGIRGGVLAHKLLRFRFGVFLEPVQVAGDAGGNQAKVVAHRFHDALGIVVQIQDEARVGGIERDEVDRA